MNEITGEGPVSTGWLILY